VVFININCGKINLINYLKGENSMIQSISSSKITKTNNYADIKSKSATQISFTGLNASKIGREVIGDTSSKVGKKIIGLAEDTIGSVKRVLRKLKGKDELPYSEKPITCDMQTNDKIDAEGKKRAAEEALASWKRKDSIKQIEASGNSFSPGDVDAHGNIASGGQHKIDNPTRGHRKHHEDFDDNSHDKLSFGGRSYDEVRKEMERVKESPWLNNKEKSEELIKLSGHNFEAGDIDSHGHLTTRGEHKIDNPSPTHRPDDRTTFKGDESTSTTNEVIQHEDGSRNVSVTKGDAVDTPPEPKKEQESFFKRLFDSILGGDDDNIDP